MIAVALLISLSCLLFFLSAPAHAASAGRATGSGRIFGQLLNGTHNNTVVVGQKVTLQMAQGNTASDLTSITTDAHGTFAYNGLDTSKTINYAVYTNYEGAQYFTDLIDLSTRAVQQVNLTVYDATSSSANLAVIRATVLLNEPDAQKGVFTVSEIYVFKNLGTTTYVGSLTGNGSNALRFSLPRNARKVSLGSGFNGYQGLAVAQGFAANAAIPPGDAEFDFSFEVPYTTSLYDFSYNVIYPTVQLSLFVPQDIHASSSGLNSVGLVSADKHPYHLFEAQVLAPGVQLHAELEGLPVSASSANSSSLDFPALWLLVVAALLGMLAILGITWLFYRSTRRSASRKQVRRDAGQNERDKSISIKKESGQQDQDEQQALLQELLDLDKAYEAGKIKKAEHQERRAQTKARLRRLMSEEMAAETTKGKGIS